MAWAQVFSPLKGENERGVENAGGAKSRSPSKPLPISRGGEPFLPAGNPLIRSEPCFGHLKLEIEFVCCLMIGIWDLGFLPMGTGLSP